MRDSSVGPARSTTRLAIVVVLTWLAVVPDGAAIGAGPAQGPGRFTAVTLARGQLALARSENKAAEEAFREVLRDEPDCIDAHRGLGQVLATTNRAREAIGHLEHVTRADPASDDAALALAQACAAAGQADRALALLALVEKRSPGRPDLAYHRGLVLLRQNRSNEALEQFRKSRSAPLAVRQSAQLCEGVALARMGKTRDAGELFASLKTSAAHPTLAELAGKLQVELARGPSGSKRTRGFVKLTQQYDDNPVIVPTTNVFGLSSQKIPTFGNLLNAQVSHDLHTGPKGGVTASYGFLGTVNYRVPDVNLQDHSLSVVGFRNYDHDGKQRQFGLQVAFDELLIGEAAFLGRWYATPYWVFRQGPRSTTTLHGSFQKKDFLNVPALYEGSVEDRDAENYALGATKTFPIGRRTWTGQVGVVGDLESAVGANVDYRGVRYTAGANGRIGETKLTLSLQAGVHSRGYDNVHSYFLVKRKDTEGIYFASLAYDLAANRQISLEYLRDRNVSNIALYDYARNTASLAMRWVF